MKVILIRYDSKEDYSEFFYIPCEKIKYFRHLEKLFIQSYAIHLVKFYFDEISITGFAFLDEILEIYQYIGNKEDNSLRIFTLVEDYKMILDDWANNPRNDNNKAPKKRIDKSVQEKVKECVYSKSKRDGYVQDSEF